MSSPDFAEIRSRCDGMMRAEVYAAIYEAAKAAPGDMFAEIGTAHGAATVCLALAARERGGEVWTFDTFSSGGRKQYAADNLEIACANIAHYGLSDMVHIRKGDAARTVADLPDRLIGLLMLDADGRIDRDMRRLYDRLAPGATIIIDDCTDRARAREMGDGAVRVDQKHRITWLLTKSLESAGLIVPKPPVNETWFGTKGEGAISHWTNSAVLGCYRKLVFATAHLPEC